MSTPDLQTFAQPLDAASLAEAFQVFARASDELTVAYSGLQGQVGVLTERLDLLLAALPAGVVVLDQQGRVEQCNGAAQDIFGVELKARDWQEFAAQALQASDTPGEWALAPVPEDPMQVRRVSISATSQTQSGGRIVLVHDVTEAWRMRLTSSRNERLASMGEMVASLAHQLRTPLSAALLYTGHLATVHLDAADRVSVAERAVERLRHLKKLIDDMLIFARGEALGREQFGACDLIAELAATIEPVARAQDIRFSCECLAQTQQLFGNRKEIASALLNLLENAIQAVGQDGEVRLSAEEDGEQVAFCVRDNGRGIPLDMQARLFEPFFTTRADGTGLGLAIARGVARAHGGDIALRSAPGEGSEFRFILSAVTSSQHDVRTERETA
ncbi:sensor histidine kinase [Uliginosibacterium sediminicola]|uniref:histidine kinase n=1 Tax=Uliginosibacterium sediminicola TaxID=2024550 RepID=A0ABU9YYM1_9RHOO